VRKVIQEGLKEFKGSREISKDRQGRQDPKVGKVSKDLKASFKMDLQ
jgi:hypothetical protein